MSKPGFTRFLSIMMGPWLRYFTGLGFSSRTFPKFTDAGSWPSALRLMMFDGRAAMGTGARAL
jgi:hypothetical protein